MHSNTKCYLDYNATAPLKPQVIQAVSEILSLPLNASSAHYYGRHAKKIVEDTRRKLAEYINCWPQEIIWCGSASEANNAIISQFQRKGVLVSAIEHSSILKVANTELIPVDTDGVIDLEWLKRRLAHENKPGLISVMAANNETGVLQPIREICDIAHANNVLVHTDAVQLFGKMFIDITALGVDYMTLGFHKSGAPQGLGALFVANGRPYTPFIKGGGQEFNRRAGTENIAAFAGLGAWFDLPNDYAHMQDLRGWLDEMELEIIPTPIRQRATIVGRNVPRLPNTSCIILPHQSHEITLMQADLSGLMISAGSACSSGRIEASHVLTAMDFSKEEAGRAVRISGGWNTTKQDIETMGNFLHENNTQKTAVNS